MDRLTIEEHGVPGFTLMEAAALAAAHELLHSIESPRGMPVVVVCGPGNNGGDGFLVALHARRAGARVQVFVSHPPAQLSGDAARACEAWMSESAEPPTLLDDSGLAALATALESDPIVVDALLGTGFSGEPRGSVAETLSVLHAGASCVFALDIPSGVDGLTGDASSHAVRAQVTVTFAVPKLGLLREPGRTHAGEIRVVDIGIPDPAVDEAGTAAHVVTPALAHSLLPPRPPEAHKGRFGHVLVVGGSPDMAGAAILATAGALRGGAGLVTTAVPSSLRARVAAAHPEALSIELPETVDGLCAEAAAPIVEQFLDRHPDTTIALGPGLSRGGEAPEFARRLAIEVETPMVIDADALNAFEGEAALLTSARGYRVLTPHPGEAGRLLGVATAAIVEDPLRAAECLAKRADAVVLLKGAPSVIAEPGGELWVNTTGNAGMARGGSGDVLTGLVAALIEQGAPHLPVPGHAAVLGSYVHGLAGDVAARRKTGWGMVAGDIARYLPSAFALVERRRTLKPAIVASSERTT